MLPSSVATFCVSYTVESQSPALVTFQGIVDRVAAAAVQTSTDSGFTYSYTVASGVTVVATPSTVSVQNLAVGSSVIVQYTISATSNSTGAYSFWYTNQCPDLEPLAIGNGYLSGSNFEGFFLPSNCNVVAPLSAGILVGFTGLTISPVGA